MASITVNGRITKAGKLEVSLPDGLPSGEVRVTIELAGQSQADEDVTRQAADWTEEQIKEVLDFKPTTLAEIIESGLAGGWEDMGITDTVEWVNKLRRNQERHLEW